MCCRFGLRHRDCRSSFSKSDRAGGTIARMDPALCPITERIRAAASAADGRFLCIRGHGTKDFYGEMPQGEPLLTGALTGITSYEPSELVVTARAGTPLVELEAAL